MKIAKKTVGKLFTRNGVPNKDAPKHKPPPLALVVDEVQTKDELDLQKSSQFYLKINPKDTLKKSAKEYKFTMYHIDGTETLRQTIQWYKDIQQVITRMNTMEAEQMTPLIGGRCKGSALTAFQARHTHDSSAQTNECNRPTSGTRTRRTKGR
jgi:hypothetical protein